MSPVPATAAPGRAEGVVVAGSPARGGQWGVTLYGHREATKAGGEDQEQSLPGAPRTRAHCSGREGNCAGGPRLPSPELWGSLTPQALICLCSPWQAPASPGGLTPESRSDTGAPPSALQPEWVEGVQDGREEKRTRASFFPL